MIKWIAIVLTVVMLLIGTFFRTMISFLPERVTPPVVNSVDDDSLVIDARWMTNSDICYGLQKGPWSGELNSKEEPICLSRTSSLTSNGNKTYCTYGGRGTWTGVYNENGLPECEKEAQQKENNEYCKLNNLDIWTGKYLTDGNPECAASQERLSNNQYCKLSGSDLWTGKYIEGGVPECMESLERSANNNYCEYFSGTSWAGSYSPDGTPICKLE